jgi:hypothetical protein
MVESDIVLLYIWSLVWWIIYAMGSSVAAVADPSEGISLRRRGKVLDIAIDEVSGALSMHAAPPVIRIIVVVVGVTVLLGHRNPPRSWTSTIGPSLPVFTIAPCVNSLLCYRIDQAA